MTRLNSHHLSNAQLGWLAAALDYRDANGQLLDAATLDQFAGYVSHSNTNGCSAPSSAELANVVGARRRDQRANRRAVTDKRRRLERNNLIACKRSVLDKRHHRTGAWMVTPWRVTITVNAEHTRPFAWAGAGAWIAHVLADTTLTTHARAVAIRLARALKASGQLDVTRDELAEHVGVFRRTAMNALALLEARGFLLVSEQVEKRSTGGRPVTVFTIAALGVADDCDEHDRLPVVEAEGDDDSADADELDDYELALADIASGEIDRLMAELDAAEYEPFTDDGDIDDLLGNGAEPDATAEVAPAESAPTGDDEPGDAPEPEPAATAATDADDVPPAEAPEHAPAATTPTDGDDAPEPAATAAAGEPAASAAARPMQRTTRGRYPGIADAAVTSEPAKKRATAAEQRAARDAKRQEANELWAKLWYPELVREAMRQAGRHRKSGDKCQPTVAVKYFVQPVLDMQAKYPAPVVQRALVKTIRAKKVPGQLHNGSWHRHWYRYAETICEGEAGSQQHRAGTQAHADQRLKELAKTVRGLLEQTATLNGVGEREAAQALLPEILSHAEALAPLYDGSVERAEYQLRLAVKQGSADIYVRRNRYGLDLLPDFLPDWDADDAPPTPQGAAAADAPVASDETPETGETPEPSAAELADKAETQADTRAVSKVTIAVEGRWLDNLAWVERLWAMCAEHPGDVPVELHTPEDGQTYPLKDADGGLVTIAPTRTFAAAVQRLKRQADDENATTTSGTTPEGVAA